LSVALLSREALGSVPPWPAFPGVSRVFVEWLLSLLVEGMVRSRCVPGGGAGDERDDDEAAVERAEGKI
jgi:hypothetical protein